MENPEVRFQKKKLNFHRNPAQTDQMNQKNITFQKEMTRRLVFFIELEREREKLGGI